MKKIIFIEDNPIQKEKNNLIIKDRIKENRSDKIHKNRITLESSKKRVILKNGIIMTRFQYNDLHRWIYLRKRKISYCSYCKNENKRIELANISGNYLKDINDYEWLCSRCHKLFDSYNNKEHTRNACKKRKENILLHRLKDEKLLCTKCNEFKNKNEFHKNKYGLFGLMAYCKLCDNKRRYKYGFS